MSVRTRLLLLVICIIVPATMACGLTGYAVYAAERARAEDNLTTTARAVAIAVDRDIDRVVSNLRILAESPSLSVDDFAMFHAEAVRAVREEGLWVVLTDRSGQQLLNTLRPWGSPLPPHPLPENVARVFQTGEAVVSDLFHGPVAGAPVAAVEIPVTRDGSVIYVLSMGVAPRHFDNVLRSLQLPRSWVGAITDSKGVAVARSQGSDRLVGKEVVPVLLKAMLQAGEGRISTTTHEGIQVRASFSRGPAYGWHVAIGVPQAEIRQAMGNGWLVASAAGLLLLLVGTAASLAVTRGITRPIGALIAATAVLGRGRAPEIAATGLHEIDVLGEAMRIAGETLADRERRLLAARLQAERAMESKSRLISAASHDLRQPVQSLALLLEVLKNGRGQEAEFAKVTKLMETALDALRSLLDGILDISRLDAGMVVPSVAPLPLGPLLARLAEEYRLRATAAGIKMRAVATSACASSDPALVERVLRNLIENALRYTPAGAVLIGARHRGEHVRVDVIDTGIGIPAEHMDDIFEEFRQLANPARDRSQGLGLGLSIVNRIAGILGAKVEAASAVGKGSRFSLLLPRSPAAAPAAPAADAPAAAGMAILVIEDEPTVRESFARMLEAAGHTVCSTAGGDAAVAMVEAGFRPALVLTDYRLVGDLDGIGAIHRVRAVLGTDLPAIVISGDTAPDTIARISAEGFRLLHKPVDAADLIRAIGAAIRPGRSGG
jgi:signal transduction histidine kinase/ActR/RegA family two-component response regulator